MGLYDHIYPTEAEKKLIAAVAQGTVCDFTDGGKLDSDAANGAGWGPERTVRAEVIIALTTLARRDWPVAAKGVRLRGVKIAGALDFEEATLGRSLWLWRCHIGETVTLRGARARTVAFQQCFLRSTMGRSIEASNFRCDESLFLKESTVLAEILLIAAEVGGSLECDRIIVAVTGGDNVFHADRLKAKGSVFLRSCRATGGIRLRGATIEGNLECDSAAFDVAAGGHGKAFDTDGMNVGGSLFLRKSVSKGEVCLRSATIGGNLECDSAAFDAVAGGDGKAFNADRVNVGGSLFLRKSVSKGEVRLLGATIGRSLECDSAIFDAVAGGHGKAFDTGGVNVGGSLFLRKSASKGEVCLRGATIEGNLECDSAAFDAVAGGDGKAFNADRVNVGGNLFLRKSVSKGEVCLLGATIGGNLECDSATFNAIAENAGISFNSASAKIERALHWRNLSKVSGNVDLRNAVIGQLNDDSTSWKETFEIYIDGFEYRSLAGRAPTDFESRRTWLAKMPKDHYVPQPYEHLVKVLRQMGHEHDARKIAIAKQDAYRERVKLGRLHEYWLRVFKATVSYGYEPWKALSWMGAWIIVGMIAFFLAFEMGAMHPSKERVFMSECYATADFESARRLGKCEGWEKVERSGINKPLYLPADYPKFQSFVYAVDVFLPFVDLHQESYWLPSDKRWGMLALVYFWLHIAVGWFLATMFIVGFTNIVKKD